MMKMIGLFVLCLAIVIECQYDVGDLCVTWAWKPGKCERLDRCPALANPNNMDDPMICSEENGVTVVCCEYQEEANNGNNQQQDVPINQRKPNRRQ